MGKFFFSLYSTFKVKGKYFENDSVFPFLLYLILYLFPWCDVSLVPEIGGLIEHFQIAGYSYIVSAVCRAGHVSMIGATPGLFLLKFANNQHGIPSPVSADQLQKGKVIFLINI